MQLKHVEEHFRAEAERLAGTVHGTLVEARARAQVHARALCERSCRTAACQAACASASVWRGPQDDYQETAGRLQDAAALLARIEEQVQVRAR